MVQLFPPLPPGPLIDGVHQQGPPPYPRLPPGPPPPYPPLPPGPPPPPLINGVHRQGPPGQMTPTTTYDPWQTVTYDPWQTMYENGIWRATRSSRWVFSCGV